LLKTFLFFPSRNQGGKTFATNSERKSATWRYLLSASNSYL